MIRFDLGGCRYFTRHYIQPHVPCYFFLRRRTREALSCDAIHDSHRKYWNGPASQELQEQRTSTTCLISSADCVNSLRAKHDDDEDFSFSSFSLFLEEMLQHAIVLYIEPLLAGE